MPQHDLSCIQAVGCVDAKASACPGPLLETKKGIGLVRIGQIMEILSSDTGTRDDLPTWAAKVGHEYLGYIESNGYDKHYIRRKR